MVPDEDAKSEISQPELSTSSEPLRRSRLGGRGRGRGRGRRRGRRPGQEGSPMAQTEEPVGTAESVAAREDEREFVEETGAIPEAPEASPDEPPPGEPEGEWGREPEPEPQLERESEPQPEREPERHREPERQHERPRAQHHYRAPQRQSRKPADPKAITEAIEDVSQIVDTLRQTLDDMEGVLETLELAERQKTADEQDIESLRRALRQLQRPRDRSPGGHQSR